MHFEWFICILISTSIYAEGDNKVCARYFPKIIVSGLMHLCCLIPVTYIKLANVGGHKTQVFPAYEVQRVTINRNHSLLLLAPILMLLLEEGCVGTDDFLGAICMDRHLHISVHHLVMRSKQVPCAGKYIPSSCH